MAENSTKRSFPADIFAEDNDKWSWSAPINTKNPLGIPNYAALRKATKDEASSSSGSENESAFRSDSNSIKRSFRKRSSSNSEGNPLEDASSSPHQSSMPRERLLPPSMYDDDARSASPSAYEKKDLAFAALFQKEFHPIAPRSCDGSQPYDSKNEKQRAPEKEMVRKYNKGLSPGEGSPKRSKAETSKPKDRKSSRSRSRDRTSVRRSRSRSYSKSGRTKSPVRDKRRSRSRDRHVDRDRHHSKSRSRRSHSRDSRSKRSHSGESRSRRSHSRDSRRRSRSRSRDRRRSRSRGYRRSRSRSYERNNRSRRRSSSRDRYRRKGYSRSRSRSRDRSKGRSGSGNRKPGSLPLSTPGGAMTPQMALQQTMAAMNAKAQALTGIALPKYYNPAAVNPLKYAEQVQKRKLLWQTADKVEEQPKSSVWDKLTFAQDQDGKMTAKFRKLMGIKSDNPTPQEEEKESVLKKQEELFRDLDQQYEMARMTTHTQRGVGLGYSAQTLYPPIPK